MKNATRGLVAGGLGVALLASGATFALWSDSAEIDGGEITAGNLQLELGDSQWRDISDDRDDSPHDIELSEFLIVPGDTIEGTYEIDAALAGDNIVAELSVQGGTATGELLDNLDITYRVVDGQGNEVIGDTAIATASTVELFASMDNSDDDHGLPMLPAQSGGGADFDVIITAEFDEDTPDQVDTNAAAVLADLVVDLEQVRTDAPGYPSTNP